MSGSGRTHADVRHAVIALGREVERRIPDRATTAWWKEERGERVFLDHNQAARDRTIASAWSVRGAEMPYPPDYPEMAGEPKRVRPSKARAD